MVSLVGKLPQGIGSAWTDLSSEEEKVGSQTGPLYGISRSMILLCLAASDESWPVPFAVLLLVVPLGVLGAFVARLRGDLARHMDGRAATDDISLMGITRAREGGNSD